jgi:hypothetical protein
MQEVVVLHLSAADRRLIEEVPTSDDILGIS